MTYEKYLGHVLFLPISDNPRSQYKIKYGKRTRKTIPEVP